VSRFGTVNALRGFVLQPTYRIESGRPVVHLWGRLENGETFLVRDGRSIPYFYVPAAEAERAARVGAAVEGQGRGQVRRQAGSRRVVASDRVSFDGSPVARIEIAVPPDAPPLRQHLQEAGIPCYEADVRFATRYLIDRGIRGSLAISGAHGEGKHVHRIYEDPEIESADWSPRLTLLSIDLETDPRARRILSAAIYGCGAAEVLLVTPPGWKAPAGAVAVADEAELLRTLRRRILELDPDVLTGWNLDDFDIPVLLRRADELGVPFALGRGPGAVRRRPGRRFREATQITIPGRLVLDGLALLRGAFVRMDSYSLEAVSRELLGEGKTITGPDKAAEILRSFREDRKRLVEYNLNDARLVLDILDKLQLVELAVERSRLTGMPPDRVHASVAAFDFLYLSALRKRGIVAPSVAPATGEGAEMGGGAVFEPRPGLYENVLLFDVRSLYPSLIRTFQIDPLGYLSPERLAEMEDADPIVAPNGAAFRREPGILPQMIDDLFPRRQAAIEAGDRVTSHAIKILMNSFFGVLGTSVCRFFNPEIANAITSWGRELLRWSRRRIEELGRPVLYGDTDSLFIESGESDPAAARRLGHELAARLNREISAHVAATWRVESRIEMQFEELYLRLFLPPVRQGTRGARKRYAGLIGTGGEGDGESRVVFTGLEVVRRDWTDLARQAQRELFERLFRDRPVEGYLEELVRRLRAGELDELLVYRKSLRKEPGEYTATTPPHVVAARKLSGRPQRRIAYVMTVAGPEPASERAHELDHQHYVDRQLRPVAEPILAELGLDFDRVIGDDRQIDLF
jgi:DNA polymerase-2